MEAARAAAVDLTKKGEAESEQLFAGNATGGAAAGGAGDAAAFGAGGGAAAAASAVAADGRAALAASGAPARAAFPSFEETSRIRSVADRRRNRGTRFLDGDWKHPGGWASSSQDSFDAVSSPMVARAGTVLHHSQTAVEAGFSLAVG